VLNAATGEHRQFFTTQPGHPAATTANNACLLWGNPISSAAKDIGDLFFVIHGTNDSQLSAPLGGTGSAWITGSSYHRHGLSKSFVLAYCVAVHAMGAFRGVRRGPGIRRAAVPRTARRSMAGPPVELPTA